MCKVTNKKKQTAWWRNEIKEHIKVNKIRMDYLNNRRQEKFNIYKKERNKVKIMVSEAKEKYLESFFTRR